MIQRYLPADTQTPRAISVIASRVIEVEPAVPGELFDRSVAIFMVWALVPLVSQRRLAALLTPKVAFIRIKLKSGYMCFIKYRYTNST